MLFRGYRNYTDMSDPQIELKRWFYERTAPHGAKARLAEASGYTPTQISRMRNFETDDPKKRQEIPLDMVAKAARFFRELPPGFEGMTQWLDGLEPSQPTEGALIPIMGHVGAGAEVHEDFEQIPEGGLERIEVPFPLPADMVALEVRGDSMLPMYDPGSVLVIYKDQRRPLHDYFGKRVVVRTADGRRFIKTMIRGSDSSRVSLISWNAQPIEDVEVTWIGEIFTVFPAEQIRKVARQILRQGGIQGQLRLKSA